MLEKAVIPAGGLGTRLLPATKEQPKEMLPIFSRLPNGALCVKPFLQIVFERLYDAGFRDFCFIVGRGKRAIEDHFSLDSNFIDYLRHRNMVELVEELTDFYERVSRSNIVFVNQPEPRGFGNAVFHAKHFTGKDPFLVHAGDDLIISKKNQYLQRLMRVFESHSSDAVLYVKKVKDPQRYGVVAGRKVEEHLYRVERIEEKPITHFSYLAIIAVYAFSSKIYGAIEKTAPDSNNEIQLTNAIRNLITDKHEVYALELGNEEKRINMARQNHIGES